MLQKQADHMAVSDETLSLLLTPKRRSYITKTKDRPGLKGGVDDPQHTTKKSLRMRKNGRLTTK